VGRIDLARSAYQEALRRDVRDEASRAYLRQIAGTK